MPTKSKRSRTIVEKPEVHSVPETVQLYRTVSLDPPWWEAGGGKIKRGADRHYDLLKTIDMPGVIYGSGEFNFEEDAHMYMWVTNNFLEDGLWLMKALGFRYITNIVWPKTKVGLGQYFRGKHELILFGVRGRGKAESVFQDTRSVASVLDVKKQSRIHSRKPDETFELIESRSKGPYLEMFADPSCEPRDDWSQWGKPRRSTQSNLS